MNTLLKHTYSLYIHALAYSHRHHSRNSSNRSDVNETKVVGANNEETEWVSESRVYDDVLEFRWGAEGCDEMMNGFG